MLGTGLGVYIPIALYIVAALTCVLSLVWRPVLGLYLLILIMPQQRLRHRIDDLPLGGHIIIILLLCVFIGALLHAEFPRRSLLNKLLVVFIIYTFLTVLLGLVFMPNTPLVYRLARWKDYMVLPGLFFATSAVIRSKKDMYVALIVLCFSGFMVNRSFALEVRQRNFSSFNEDARDLGPLGLGSNHTAAYEAQTALCLFALAAAQKKLRYKLLLLALFALNLYCVLFAFSRAAYLGFAVGLLFLLLIKHRKWIPVLVLLAIGWQLVLPTAVVQRVSMTRDSSGDLDNSAAMRLELWDDAINLFVANPITGWGYNTYHFMGRIGSLRDTHNFYVLTLVETGLIGLIIILAILWKFFRMSWSLYKRAEDSLMKAFGLGMTACTVCVLIVNLFGDRWSFVEVNGVVWVAFGLIAYVLAELDEKPQLESPQLEIAKPEVLQPAF
jgi:putative inorganic carbon (hco3(-)) transporter